MIPKMLRRLFALLLVGVGCGLAQVTVPDTPAGHTLQAWLNAFNSGDRARIETYVKTVDQSQSVEGLISFRNQTGGFELLSIESSEPLHIRFRVRSDGFAPCAASAHTGDKRRRISDCGLGRSFWF